MDRKDNIVGYIEYLDSDGIVRERIPFNDAEAFKESIYEALGCGVPMTPVIFPEKLEEPIQFEKGTCFPWGFRSEKRELLPYEIYQTQNRNIVFTAHEYAESRMKASDYKLVYCGQRDCWQTLDAIYCLHNQDDRPNARKMRSVSVSDIIVLHENGESHAYYIEPIGYKKVDSLLPELGKSKDYKVHNKSRQSVNLYIE